MTNTVNVRNRKFEAFPVHFNVNTLFISTFLIRCKLNVNKEICCYSNLGYVVCFKVSSTTSLISRVSVFCFTKGVQIV